MLLQVVCIRDRGADVFGTPYFSVTIGSAIRGFTDEINRVHENNVMNKHPEDFDLYHLGVYDDADGSFVCHKPVMKAVGKDCIGARG